MGDEAGDRTKGGLDRVFEIINFQNLKIIRKTVIRWEDIDSNWYKIEENTWISISIIIKTATNNKREKSPDKKGNRWDRRGSSI